MEVIKEDVQSEPSIHFQIQQWEEDNHIFFLKTSETGLLCHFLDTSVSTPCSGLPNKLTKNTQGDALKDLMSALLLQGWITTTVHMLNMKNLLNMFSLILNPLSTYKNEIMGCHTWLNIHILILYIYAKKNPTTTNVLYIMRNTLNVAFRENNLLQTAGKYESFLLHLM